MSRMPKQSALSQAVREHCGVGVRQTLAASVPEALAGSGGIGYPMSQGCSRFPFGRVGLALHSQFSESSVSRSCWLRVHFC